MPDRSPDSLVEHRNRRGAEQVVGHTLVVRRDDWRTVWSQFYFVRGATPPFVNQARSVAAPIEISRF